MPYQQGLDSRQLAAALQIEHHPVNMIQIFIQIFDEQHFTVGVDVGRGPDEGVEDGKVASG